MSKDVYFSIDIEADGPCPGLNSMLSAGAAAFDNDGRLIDTWEANFLELPGATQDPDTMAWWSKQTKAWDAAMKNRRDPFQAIQEMSDWIHKIRAGKRAVFVGYPMIYDFKFIDHYMLRFLKSNPFGHSSAIDIKTMAWDALGFPNYGGVVKKNFPKKWMNFSRKHTHVAIDDAIEQGELFFNIRNWMIENRKLSA